MRIRNCFILAALGVLTLSLTALAQSSPGRSQLKSAAQPPEQPVSIPQNSTDGVTAQLLLMRESIESIAAGLRDIGQAIRGPATKQGAPGASDKQHPIAVALDLLTRAEQRAEILRKQVLELIEKEVTLKNRLAQIEEDIRPESIDRAASLSGSTRTLELRELRRRQLDNERRTLEILLNQYTQSRSKLEDDVKQADALVLRMRLRIFPLIDREIEKLSPN